MEVRRLQGVDNRLINKADLVEDKHLKMVTIHLQIKDDHKIIRTTMVTSRTKMISISIIQVLTHRMHKGFGEKLNNNHNLARTNIVKQVTSSSLGFNNANKTIVKAIGKSILNIIMRTPNMVEAPINMVILKMKQNGVGAIPKKNKSFMTMSRKQMINLASVIEKVGSTIGKQSLPQTLKMPNIMTKTQCSTSLKGTDIMPLPKRKQTTRNTHLMKTVILMRRIVGFKQDKICSKTVGCHNSISVCTTHIRFVTTKQWTYHTGPYLALTKNFSNAKNGLIHKLMKV